MRFHSVPLLLSLLAAPAALYAQADSRELTSAPRTAPATRPASLFDPARHMKVSEVRPGMKGYGLTVMSGTKIERFDVEVISLLHNSFGPQQSVIMIRCLGETMQHFGPIAGCSGSPIYLFDDAGKPRLIGAYAFGFDTAKDPIVGVQPIEYMLELHAPPAGVNDTATTPVASVPRTWSMLESSSWRASLRDRNVTPLKQNGPSPAKHVFKPLAVPIAVRGASESMLAGLRPMFQAQGFEPLLAPGTTTQAADTSTILEPGSVMGAAVLTGDLELTALGTCTEVIDGRAFGFGHPFNGEGATSIPMGPGTISLVMPLLTSSFKLGGITSATGAIDMDGTAGVAGQIGATARTVPIEITVNGVDDASPRTFRYRAALHRAFTPMMVATALQASIVAGQQLPVEHSATYSVTMTFAGGRELKINNIATSLDGFDLARDAVWPISTAMDNPFLNVPVESVKASVEVKRGANIAQIETAAAAQPVYRPGETARINVRLRRYKGEAFLHTIEVPLPTTLTDGEYAVTVGDASTALIADMMARPDRLAVRNVDELFVAMKMLANAGRNDALYTRLGGLVEGVAIGRTALTKLPPSRRAVLIASGRPDVAGVSDGQTSVTPMDGVISGNAEATIRVQKKLP